MNDAVPVELDNGSQKLMETLNVPHLLALSHILPFTNTPWNTSTLDENQLDTDDDTDEEDSDCEILPALSERLINWEMQSLLKLAIELRVYIDDIIRKTIALTEERLRRSTMSGRKPPARKIVLHDVLLTLRLKHLSVSKAQRRKRKQWESMLQHFVESLKPGKNSKRQNKKSSFKSQVKSEPVAEGLD